MGNLDIRACFIQNFLFFFFSFQKKVPVGNWFLGVLIACAWVDVEVDVDDDNDKKSFLVPCDTMDVIDGLSWQASI